MAEDQCLTYLSREYKLMDGIAAVIEALNKYHIITLAFLLGAILFLVALLGVIPIPEGPKLSFSSRLFAGCSGVFFMGLAIFAAIFPDISLTIGTTSSGQTGFSAITPTATTITVAQASNGISTRRSDVLVLYDALYNQQGWCGLWQRLINDGLVTGECPDPTGNVARENIETGEGSKSLVTGNQISIHTDVTISFPACINFEPRLVEYSDDGLVIDWVPPTQTGTNFTVYAGSLFTLYFRCDHVAELNLASYREFTQLSTSTPSRATQIAPTSIQANSPCSAPSGLVELARATNGIWSNGIYATVNVVAYTPSAGRINSGSSGLSFEIWISPCAEQQHGYVEGVRFWRQGPQGEQIYPVTDCITVPIGEVKQVSLPPDTYWGLGNDTQGLNPSCTYG